METASPIGSPYILPKAELRLTVEVFREGDRIAVAKVSLDEMAEQLAEFTSDYIRWRRAAVA